MNKYKVESIYKALKRPEPKDPKQVLTEDELKTYSTKVKPSRREESR